MKTAEMQVKSGTTDIHAQQKKINVYKVLNYFFLVLITGLTAVPLFWSWKAAFMAA
jgi:hypothetical protein